MSSTIENFIVKVTTQGAEKLDQIASSAENVRGKIEGLQTALLGVGLAAFIKSAAEAADALDDLSQATGITLGSIQALGLALEASGGKFKNTEKTILSFFNAVELAADGGYKQQKAFKELGVTLDDLRTLSEADLFNKVIDRLKGMEEGSNRSQLAATLLGKAFRSVNPAQFADELEKARGKAEENAVQTKKLADFNQQLEKNYRNLQMAVAEVFGPILEAFGPLLDNTKTAKVLVMALGASMLVSFGAAAVSGIKGVVEAIIDLNKAKKAGLAIDAVTAALSGPKGWAGIAAAVGIAAGAYYGLDALLEKITGKQEEVANRPKGKGGGVQGKEAGGARDVKQAYSDEERAAMDSAKKIAISRAEITKNLQMSTNDDIKNIRLQAEADIAKAEIEINSNLNLSKQKKAEELAAKKVEIETKAAFDIAKIQEELNKQLKDQIDTIKKTTEEKQAAFDLEKKFLGVGSDQIALQKELLDIELKRKQAIEDAAKIKNMDPGSLSKQIESINALADADKARAEAQYEYQRSFEKGWADAYANFVSNGTNAAKIAGDSFNSITNNMMSALDRFVETGKFNFSDFTRSIILDLLKIQMRASLVQIMGASGIGSLFGLPGKAVGGPVQSGQPYIVGEKGPEIFLPNTSGSIVPNNKIGGKGMGMGGNTYITNNISAIDSKSVAQLFAENRMTLFGTVEQARRELPLRTR